MQDMKKVFSGFFLLVFSSFSFIFQLPVFANPTLSDVLSKGGNLQSSSPNTLYIALTAGLFFFAALSVTGYKLLRKKGEGGSVTVLLDNPKDGEINGLRREVKELTFQNEELNRELSGLSEEKDHLFEEKQRLEDVVQSRVIAEELLKKSNEALRRAYDKLLSEKEGLVLEMSREDFLDDKQQTMFEVNTDSPEKQAELKAVEDLINEVGKTISFKKDKAPAKKTKSKAPKNKTVAGARKGTGKTKKK